MSRTKGVKRTKSARAVRSSGLQTRETRFRNRRGRLENLPSSKRGDVLSHAKKNALAPTHANSGAAEGKVKPTAIAPSASSAHRFLTCRATLGWRVAMETLRWARSNSRSQLAMLMQLSEQSDANMRAATAEIGVLGRRGKTASQERAGMGEQLAGTRGAL